MSEKNKYSYILSIQPWIPNQNYYCGPSNFYFGNKEGFNSILSKYICAYKLLFHSTS